MSKYNVETETVETYEKVDSVVLIPSTGKLIFNASKVIVLESGEELQESSVSASTTVEESSDIYKAIMAAYASAEVPENG